MIDIKFTSEMEKAMHQFHGMGYNEYRRTHKKRMKVERKRERNYRSSQIVTANLKGKLFLSMLN
jgi:hypothetical protein